MRWRAVAEVTVLRELEVAGRREEDRVELVDVLLDAYQQARSRRCRVSNGAYLLLHGGALASCCWAGAVLGGSVLTANVMQLHIHRISCIVGLYYHRHIGYLDVRNRHPIMIIRSVGYVGGCPDIRRYRRISDMLCGNYSTI